MHELKVFIRRAEVRAQFRAHLRAATRVPGAAGADVLEQVRSTWNHSVSRSARAPAAKTTRRRYRRHQAERDDFAIKQLVAEGRRTLQEVLALAEKDAGPSADYEVGEEWPWAAAAAPAAPPRPLGLPRYGD